jgi:SAM-dependent methyltransferase
MPKMSGTSPRRSWPWKKAAYRAFDRFVPTIPFRYLPPRQTVRLAYQLVLDREPDEPAMDQFVQGLLDGKISRRGIVESLIHSEELRSTVPIQNILLSMHVSRCEFVKSMPKASRILDLGGTHQGFPDGALVHLGYPYRFDHLLVVDLPPEERHKIYRGGSDGASVQSPLGPVEFAFHSMTELDHYPDASFDLVYSGQSIEHITESDGERVIKEVHRLLVPGGWFCLDTPNGPAWRLKSEEVMNPDHKIEYSSDLLVAKLSEAGFNVEEVNGLNYMGNAFARGVFDEKEASGNPGVFWAVDECLLIAIVAQRPG